MIEQFAKLCRFAPLSRSRERGEHHGSIEPAACRTPDFRKFSISAVTSLKQYVRRPTQSAQLFLKMTTDRKYPFFEKGLLLPRWKLKKEPAHCMAVDAKEYCLATDRLPPALRDQPPAPSAPKKPPKSKRPFKSLIEVLLDFKEWLDTPAPPKPRPRPKAVPTPRPKATPTARPSKKPEVKPFDLLDVPDAMDRIHWPMSAKVIRKWFAGELNYCTTIAGAAHGISQNGRPFPPSMIDTTMFSLDWILQYPRARAALEDLINYRIFSSSAKRVLASKFKDKETSPYFRDGWRDCEGDLHRFHATYQFQFARVDTDVADKFAMLLRGAALPNGIFMDDLYGSLGAFAFYASIGEHYFYSRGAHGGRLEIHSAYLYMRDVFTFFDRDADTQYLGHWNKTGFIIPMRIAMAHHITNSDWLMFPVARNGAISTAEVYYPICNRDYRNWQFKHKQGGDLILYSNKKLIKLSEPIVVEV